MTKRFDLDVGKRKARKRFKDFLAKRLVNRKKTFVVCFPGEQGLEIEQVYRPLGIPDRNIIGVERDKRAAAVIRRRYPDIQLFVGEISEFAKQYDGPPLSVISLDYCGNLSSDKLAPLGMLYAGGHINDRAVIMCNVMAGREDRELQEQFKCSYAKSTLHTGFGPVSPEEAVLHLDDTSSKQVGEVRGDVMTYGVVSTLTYTTPALKVSYGLDLTISGTAIRLGAGAFIREEDGKQIIGNASFADLENDKIGAALAIKDEAIRDVSKQFAQEGFVDLARPLSVKTGIPMSYFQYEIPRVLVMNWFDRVSNPLFPVAVDRFSYISDSGKRMLTDVYDVRTFDLSFMPPLVDVVMEPMGNRNHHFTMKVFHNREYLLVMHQAVIQYAKRFCAQTKVEMDAWPDREDLGGGEAIGVNMDNQRLRARELFSKGRSISEVVEKVKFLCFDELETIYQEFHPKVQKPEAGSVRDRVIHLLQEGHSTSDVVRMVPGVTVGSARAIKAHISMGTYGKKQT